MAIQNKIKKPETKKWAWIPLWVWPALICFSVGTVWLRLHVVRVTYAVDQATKDLKVLKQTREDMELKVAAAKSPRRLELLAKSRFQLQHPRSDQIIQAEVLNRETRESYEARAPRNAP